MTKPHVRVRREPNPDEGWPDYGPPNRVYLTFRDPKSDKFYSIRYNDEDRNLSIKAQEYMFAEVTRRFTSVPSSPQEETSTRSYPER